MAQWIDILLANNHTYDNSTSGLAASDVKAALDELAAAGGTPSAGGASWPVTQAAHGFSVGDPIYFDGTDWVLAQADSVDHVHVGVVSAVADVDTFTITLAGTVSGLSGLTSGTWYYLSQDTAGGLVDPAPTSGVRAAVLQATSATTAIVVPYIPQEEVDSGSATVYAKTQVVDSVTSLEFAIDDPSQIYNLYCRNVSDQSGSAVVRRFGFQVSTDGGSTYITSGYATHWDMGISTSEVAEISPVTSMSVLINAFKGVAANTAIAHAALIGLDGSGQSMSLGLYGLVNDVPLLASGNLYSQLPGLAAPVTNIKLLMSDDVAFSGEFTLVPVATSQASIPSSVVSGSYNDASALVVDNAMDLENHAYRIVIDDIVPGTAGITASLAFRSATPENITATLVGIYLSAKLGTNIQSNGALTTLPYTALNSMVGTKSHRIELTIRKCGSEYHIDGIGINWYSGDNYCYRNIVTLVLSAPSAPITGLSLTPSSSTLSANYTISLVN